MLDEILAAIVFRRDRLGLRLRRARHQTLARQARQHPLVHARSSALYLQPRSERSNPVHGARAGWRPEGRARQNSHRRLVAHHSLAHRQGKDRLRHTEAAGNPGAHRARPLQPRRPGAGLLRRQRNHGRGGGQERPCLLHGRPESGSDCRHGKTVAKYGPRIDRWSSGLFSEGGNG